MCGRKGGSHTALGGKGVSHNVLGGKGVSHNVLGKGGSHDGHQNDASDGQRHVKLLNLRLAHNVRMMRPEQCKLVFVVAK
jgi:hypothetical protein